MITLTFPGYFTEDFVQLIPAQRAKIVELLTEGKLASFSLSMERSHGWMVARGESVAEIEEMLEDFPMYDYFDYDIAELAMYDTQHLGLPELMMN